MSSLTQAEMQNILDGVMQDITHRLADIRLNKQDIDLSDDVCTVHTTFEGGYHATLTLHVDTALLVRLAQRVLGEEKITRQDLEDFTKEYFNVICGQIVARMFQAAHISARFHIPSFCRGWYMPMGESGSKWELDYSGGSHEGARLIHQVPEKNASA